MRNTVRPARSRFYGMLSLLLLLVMARYGLQLGVPRAVFIPVIVLTAMMGDASEIIAVCLCCIPLHEAVDFFYSLVLSICVYLIKEYRSIRIHVGIFSVLAMVLWELFHCLGQSFSIMAFITNVAPLLILVIVMSTDVRKLDYPFIVRAYALATAGLCLTLLVRVLYRSGFNLLLALSGLQRLGVEDPNSAVSATAAGGVVNPNTLGIICVLAVTGLLQLRTSGSGRTSDMLMACMIMVFGALTSSRTYLVCLALMFVLLLLSQKGSIGAKLRFLAIVLVLLALALTVLYLCFPDLMEYYVSRFDTRDITTGRDQLMTLYHDFIISNPRVLLFGVGLQDLSVKLTEMYRVAFNVPHNSIQELVAAWGLPGLILFSVMLGTMIPVSRQFCRRQGLLNYIPLLIILVKSMAGQLLNSPYSMLTLSYAYLSMSSELLLPEDNRLSPEPKKIQKGSGVNINQIRRKPSK